MNESSVLLVGAAETFDDDSHKKIDHQKEGAPLYPCQEIYHYSSERQRVLLFCKSRAQKRKE